MTTVADLIEARRLRNTARAIVRTDVATLRLDLAERPLATRVRDQVVSTTTQVIDDGVALANENRAIVGLTIGAVFAWLFRKPLGRLVQAIYARIEQAFARWRG